MAIEGKKLAACFKVASAACLEVEQFSQLLTNLLTKRLVEKKINTQKLNVSYRHDQSTWIYTDVAQSIGIAFPPKRNSSKYLGYQISLIGDGLMLGEEPLVHFFYWDCVIDFKEIWISSPFSFEQEFTIKENHLVQWSEEESDEWMFSIRLVAINNENDIKQIVEEIVNLIGKENTNSISKLPGIISYRIEAGNLKY